MGDLIIQKLIREMLKETSQSSLTNPPGRPQITKIKNRDQWNAMSDDAKIDFINDKEGKVSVDKDYPGSHEPMIDAGITEFQSNLCAVFSKDIDYIMSVRYVVESSQTDARTTSGPYHGSVSHAIRHGAEINIEKYRVALGSIDNIIRDGFKTGDIQICRFKRGIGLGNLVEIFSTDANIIRGISSKSPTISTRRGEIPIIKCNHVRANYVDNFFNNQYFIGRNQNIMTNTLPSSNIVNETELGRSCYNLGTSANTLDRFNDIRMGHSIEGDFSSESLGKTILDNFTIGVDSFYGAFKEEMNQISLNLKYINNDEFKDAIFKSIDNKEKAGSIARLNVQMPDLNGEISDMYAIEIKWDGTDSPRINEIVEHLSRNREKYIAHRQGNSNNQSLSFIGDETFILGLQNIDKKYNKPFDELEYIKSNDFEQAIESVLEKIKKEGSGCVGCLLISNSSGYMIPMFNLKTGQFVIYTKDRDEGISQNGWKILTFLSIKGSGTIGNPSSVGDMMSKLKNAEIKGENENFSIFMHYLNLKVGSSSKLGQSIPPKNTADALNIITSTPGYIPSGIDSQREIPPELLNKLIKIAQKEADKRTKKVELTNSEESEV